MKPVWVIAGNVFRQSLQNRSFVLVFFFWVAAIFLAQAAVPSDPTQREKIILDAGLSLLKLFGLALAVFQALPLVAQERQYRTLHAMLALSLDRSQVLAGYLLGVILTVLVLLALAAGGFLILLFMLQVPVTILLFRCLVGLAIELAVISSVALFFGVATGFFPGLVGSVFFYLIGNLTYSMHVMVHETAPGLGRWFFTLLYYLMPNLTLFNLKDAAINAVQPMWSYDLLALVYGGSLVAVFYLLGVWVFEWEELTT